MAQTLSHTAVLQASADELWESCKQADRIFCEQLPEYFVKVEYLQGHGEPGSIRLVTTGPAIKHARFLKERMDKFDDATKTLGYTVLEGDSRYSAFSAEIQFVAMDATVTEATWTAKFVPVGDMGPPEHIKAVAELVFQTLEKEVHMKKTFTHTETLYLDEIALEQLAQEFEASTMVEGHEGMRTVRVRMFGPEIQFAETVTERMDFIDADEKRMGYTVLKVDSRYKYFAATMYFTAGPSAGSTKSMWMASYVPDGDMVPPEDIREVVRSVWSILAGIVEVERYA